MSYTYQISAYRYGGEHTIGTIPRKVALWWMQNHSDDFEHYFMQDDKTHDSEDNWGHIPEEYRLENFYENADILHHDCCEFSDEGWIEVNLIDEIKKTVVVVQVDEDGNEHPPIERRILPKEIANIKFEDIDQSEDNVVNFVSWEELLEENNPDIFHKIYPKDNNTLPELCAVYGQRFFKGGWVFSRFTTNHKFDASKLIFTTKQFEDSLLLVGFKYEDEEIRLYSSDGDHKWDRAWIDDYLLD